MEHISAFAYTPLKNDEKYLPKQVNQLIQSGSEFISRVSNKQPLFEVWSPDCALKQLITSSDPETWFVLEAQLGIPELYSATQDHFILQYLNLQELGAVSFKKGCYTGQEIIARMKFLGKLKKKMYLLSSPSKDTAEPGSDIYDKHSKKCGVVVRSHWSDATGSITLGVLNISYSDGDAKVYLTTEKKVPFSANQINYDI
jgi:folate-binding protein YgfZ